jgi:hypothetical protein
MPALIALALAALVVASRRARSMVQPKAGDLWTVTFEVRAAHAITDAIVLEAYKTLQQKSGDLVGEKGLIDIMSFGVLRSADPGHLWVNIVVQFRRTPTKALPTSGTWNADLDGLGPTRIDLKLTRPGDHRLAGASEYVGTTWATATPAAAA